MSVLLHDLPRVSADQLMERISPVHQQIRRSPFYESHISAATFSENKNGFRQRPPTSSLTFHLQCRSFKTHRAVVEPTITEQLRSRFQARRAGLEGHRTNIYREKMAAQADTESSDKLKGPPHCTTISSQ